jgi:hypothetical protein
LLQFEQPSSFLLHGEQENNKGTIDQNHEPHSHTSNLIVEKRYADVPILSKELTFKNRTNTATLENILLKE